MCFKIPDLLPKENFTKVLVPSSEPQKYLTLHHGTCAVVLLLFIKMRGFL